MNGLIVKITDKNLSLAVLDADWYDTQCRLLLADVSTYDLIDLNDLRYYQQEAFNRIAELSQSSQLDSSTAEYLLASREDHCDPSKSACSLGSLI
jgi:hypothetical protein